MRLEIAEMKVKVGSIEPTFTFISPTRQGGFCRATLAGVEALYRIHQPAKVASDEGGLYRAHLHQPPP